MKTNGTKAEDLSVLEELYVKYREISAQESNKMRLQVQLEILLGMRPNIAKDGQMNSYDRWRKLDASTSAFEAK